MGSDDGWVLTRQQVTAWTYFTEANTNGLVQDCSNSIANALELLQSCTEPSICAA